MAVIGVLGSGDSPRPEDVRALRTGGHRAHAPGVPAELAGRPACRSLVLLAVLLGALALASAPALALTQKGHVFSFSFGAPGRGEEQFQHPSGVAVNNLTGEVYVADRNDNRVEEFKPVLNGKGELIGEKQVGEFTVPYPVDIAVDNSAEASDPSRGDVYVVGANGEEKKEPAPENFWVYKFKAGGEKITVLKTFTIKVKGGVSFEEELGEIKGVAVDPSGSLLVSQGDEIYRFDDKKKNGGVARVRSGAGEAQPGLAVDSAGELYVGTGEPRGLSEFEDELTEEIEAEGEQAGLFEGIHVIAKLAGATGTVTIPELDPEYTTAVAVNTAAKERNGVSEANDVYLDNVASAGGEDVTTVAAFNPQGGLIQRFGAPGLKDGDGVAVDSQTGAVYVADAKADEVDVFELEQQGAPAVAGLSACTLDAAPGCPSAAEATTLRAQVDPTGADTHYWFEYGAGSCAAVPSTCTPTPQKDVGKGFADEAASVELPSLATGLYHYRVVASNEFGTVYSGEQTFTILASASGLPDNREWEMVSEPEKHGAEPEAMEEGGGAIQASAEGNAITYIADGPMGADVEGNRSLEFSQILSTRSPRGWSSQDITTPNAVARGILVGQRSNVEYQLFSPTLALALVEPFPGPQEFFGPLAEPPLSPPLSEREKQLQEKGKGYQEQTIYLRADGPEELLKPAASEVEDYNEAIADGKTMTPRNAGYLALVSELNEPGKEPFGGAVGTSSDNGVEFSTAATPDLSHVVFYSHRADPGIYEWGPKGSVQPVSVLPGGALTATANVGGLTGRDVRHAISEEGTLVFWTSTEQHSQHLYVRDTVTQETLQLDAVQPGASGAGEVTPQFQTASADGSKVFFTDTQRLTAESKAGKFDEVAMPDLYVAELSGGRETGSPLSVAVTDLTPQGINGESADIQTQENQGGGVLAASEDGSYVYYVADGALAPGATRGYCSPEEVKRPPGTTCNLYVRHYNAKAQEWEPTRLVAALSDEDMPDWGGLGIPGALDFMTSQVSPSGQYLAFMSDRRLTGYDNEDVTSKQPGERLDEEVYLYDANSGSLVCASCNPNGTRPAGVFDAGDQGESEEGVGLVVDRPQIWAEAYSPLVDHWLAGSVPGWTPIGQATAPYQSRYLSNSGRLFFNSPEDLVPAATSPKEKVYEYEPSGVGSCRDGEGGCVGLISSGTSQHESAFLDASASGNDVFFLTLDRLVQQDVDDYFDVYDARVCESSSPCLPPPAGGSPPCKTVEQCKPWSPSSTEFEAPASTSASGSGNMVAHVQQQVLAQKAEKAAVKPAPKPLTRAQKLAKALKACRNDRKKKTRIACEKQARERYGPIKKRAKKSSTEGRRG